MFCLFVEPKYFGSGKTIFKSISSTDALSRTLGNENLSEVFNLLMNETSISQKDNNIHELQLETIIT